MKNWLIGSIWTTALMLGAVGSVQACTYLDLGCNDSISETYKDKWLSDGMTTKVDWDWTVPQDKKISEVTLDLTYWSVSSDSAWSVTVTSGTESRTYDLPYAREAEYGKLPTTWSIAWGAGDNSFLTALKTESELSFTFNDLLTGHHDDCDSWVKLKSYNISTDCQAVPLPAAGWLFGSALIGAVAAGRRKKRQHA